MRLARSTQEHSGHGLLWLLAWLLLAPTLGCSRPDSEPRKQPAIDFENDAVAQSDLKTVMATLDNRRICTQAELDVLEKLHQRYPGSRKVRGGLHRALTMRGDLGGATQLLEKVPLDERTPLESRLLAKHLITAGKFSEADEILKPLLQGSPSDPVLVKLVAEAKIGQGAYAEAAKLLDQVWHQAAFAQDPEACYLRGLAHHHQGENAQAAPLLQKSLELRPEHAPTHYALARVLAASGQESQAVRHRDLFLSLTEAQNAEANRMMQLSALGTELNVAFNGARYQDCERLIMESLAIADDSLKVQLQAYLGRVYEAMGKREEAIAAMAEAERIRKELNKTP